MRFVGLIIAGLGFGVLNVGWIYGIITAPTASDSAFITLFGGLIYLAIGVFLYQKYDGL